MTEAPGADCLLPPPGPRPSVGIVPGPTEAKQRAPGLGASPRRGRCWSWPCSEPASRAEGAPRGSSARPASALSPPFCPPGLWRWGWGSCPSLVRPILLRPLSCLPGGQETSPPVHLLARPVRYLPVVCPAEAVLWGWVWVRGLPVPCTCRLTGPPFLQLQIWDTAGQERFRTITQSYYRSANGAILAYDITKRSSFLSVPHWIEDVRKYAGSNIVQLLIGNKSDLGQLREVPLAEAQGLAEHYDILCAIETSAKDSSNVEEAFVRVATELVVRHGGPRLSEKGADHIQLDSKDVAESWGCGC
uniref:RAB43, member RAS oncogene family n=1 Tax=Bos mutus grunniens TaxID=30521 RepID=A0A8B9XJ64_BOSMU